MGRKQQIKAERRQGKALSRELERDFRTRMAAAVEVDVPLHLRVGVQANRFYPSECYPQTYAYMNRHRQQDVRLVHGLIRSAKGIQVAHAWIELPGEVVFESVAQRFYTRASYYAVRGAIPEVVYTWAEMDAQVTSSGHSGPWHASRAHLQLETQLHQHLATQVQGKVQGT